MTRIFAAATLLAITACAAPQNRTTSAPASAPSSPPAASQASAAGMTEPQARMHAMNGGYSNVSTLTKNEDGTWRGNGSKGGRTVDFVVDPQGKIATR